MFPGIRDTGEIQVESYDFETNINFDSSSVGNIYQQKYCSVLYASDRCLMYDVLTLTAFGTILVVTGSIHNGEVFMSARWSLTVRAHYCAAAIYTMRQ